MKDQKSSFSITLANGFDRKGKKLTVTIKSGIFTGDELRVAKLLRSSSKMTIATIVRLLNDMGSHEKYEYPRKKTTPRRVYQIVRNLREMNFPVVGDHRGIRLAKSVGEIVEFTDLLKEKARADVRSVNFLSRKMLESVSEKQELFK